MELTALITLLLLSLNAMVPIALAATGEVMGERAGVVNIGLEGILAIGALTGTLGAELTGSALLGMLMGMATGALIGLLHGTISVYGRGDQIISGVGINVFALGFVPFAIIAIWRTPGIRQVKAEYQMPSLYASELGNLSWLVPLTLVLALITWLILHRSVFGLRVKAAGENPEAADVAGIAVERVRLWATVYGATLVGLAGAYISLDWNHVVTKEPAAGRGFIALATVVFSKLNPLLAVLGGFVFGFFQTLGDWLPNLPEANKVVPYYFVRMIPYVGTILVVAGAIGQARFPKALAIPYRRE